MKPSTNLKVDIAHSGFVSPVEAVQGDGGIRSISVELTDRGKPWYPPAGTEIAVPFFSGGLHHRIVVDLDLVARLGVGGVQCPFFLVGKVGDGEDPYISLGPKNGQKITLPGSKSSSLGGYFHYFGMITALEDSSNPRNEPRWVGL